jgi:hypothetical protein
MGRNKTAANGSRRNHLPGAEPEAVEPVGVERIAEQVHEALLRGLRAEPGASAEVVAALHLLAEHTGENRYRFAARIIGGLECRRPSIDDRAALRRIASFPPERQRAAVGIVARDMAGAGATDAAVVAIATRLRRKRKSNK